MVAIIGHSLARSLPPTILRTFQNYLRPQALLRSQLPSFTSFIHHLCLSSLLLHSTVQSTVYSLRTTFHLINKMRFTTIVTALSAVAIAGVMSATVDQPKVGIATDGNVTATVEMIKTDDGSDVARITYTALDVDHPDKLAAPVSRLCWKIGREYQPTKTPEDGDKSSLYEKNSSADSASQSASPLFPPPWFLALLRPLPSEPVSNRYSTLPFTSPTEQTKSWLFVADSASHSDLAADAACAAAAANAGINLVSLGLFLDRGVRLNTNPLDVAQRL